MNSMGMVSIKPKPECGSCRWGSLAHCITPANVNLPIESMCNSEVTSVVSS